MTLKSKLKIASAMAVLALVGAGSVAQAANLVANGNFTNGGTAVADPLTNNPDFSGQEALTNWTSHGYSFVFTNITGAGANPGVTLKSVTAPPLGENYVGIDPAYKNPGGGASTAAGISQNVTGLTAGLTYALTFEWAGAQQTTFSGATAEWWLVDFGGLTQQSTAHTAVGNTSPANTNPVFSGWFDTSFTFVASGASEVITFLAEGTGTSGEPPFDLLANVGVAQVPEPASIAMFGAGIAGLGGLAVARRRKKK